jgi:hypothetical protein
MAKRTFISVETTQEIKEALKRKASMEGKTNCYRCYFKHG